jgi:hypothetical protein
MVAGHAASPAHAQGGQNTATERIIEEKCEKGEDEHGPTRKGLPVGELNPGLDGDSVGYWPLY